VHMTHARMSLGVRRGSRGPAVIALARLCTISSLASKCAGPLLGRKALLKRLGTPAAKNKDGPAVLFHGHLHGPDVEKVGGGEPPYIPCHTGRPERAAVTVTLWKLPSAAPPKNVQSRVETRDRPSQLSDQAPAPSIGGCARRLPHTHRVQGSDISFKTASLLVGYTRGQGGGLQRLMAHERCRMMAT
jgi:hypothetical protein